MVVAWIAPADGDPAPLGFYLLGAMAVRADLGPRKWQRAGVPDIPVIYIPAVAVRDDIQGKELGTARVVDAMRRCLGIADQIGAAAIVLDVLKDDHFDRRRSFCEELGVRPPGNPENPGRVFIPRANLLARLG